MNVLAKHDHTNEELIAMVAPDDKGGEKEEIDNEESANKNKDFKNKIDTQRRWKNSIEKSDERSGGRPFSTNLRSNWFDYGTLFSTTMKKKKLKKKLTGFSN